MKSEITHSNDSMPVLITQVSDPAWARLKAYYERWAHFPPSWTNLKTRKAHWWNERGAVAFQRFGQTLVVAGEPVSHVSPQDVFDEFLCWARDQGLKATGYYTSEHIESGEMNRVPCGTATLVDLRNFATQGRERSELRRSFNQGARAGLRVEEVDAHKLSKNRDKLFAAYREWRKRKGRLKIEFFLSEPDFKPDPLIGTLERHWVCWNGDRVDAYVSMLPYRKGESVAYYVDHLIQNPRGHRFALDYLVAEIFLNLHRECVPEVSLGFNAFADCPFSLHPRGIFWFLEKNNWFYNASGLRYFKNKFGLSTEVRRYLWKAPWTPGWQAYWSIAQTSFSIHPFHARGVN